jgi:addiction module RelE/StbE family toxin
MVFREARSCDVEYSRLPAHKKSITEAQSFFHMSHHFFIAPTAKPWTIDQLAQDIPLPAKWKDHQLKGNMKRFRECHIGGSGDWLLVYEKRETDMIPYLLGTGSHTHLLGI